MNTAAIYHRPESEFAYLYTTDTMHIRLRTARGDVRSVSLLHGDPYPDIQNETCQIPK